MSPRTIRRAAERQAAKLAAKAAKVMTASVGSTDTNVNPVQPVVDFEPSEKRPISDAKLAANRANARLSHGAVTEEGRKASSMNALRHGLTAKSAVLPGDDAAAYEQLVESHFERYSPASDEENELVQLIADNAWRIFKIAPLEAGIYEVGRIEHGENLFMQEKDPVRRATLVTAAIAMLYKDHLKNLHLQERRVRNQHKSDIAKLKELQTERFERPKREAKQAAEDNDALIHRVSKLVEESKHYALPFDPAEFGLDFTIDEWQAFRTPDKNRYLVASEHLDFKKFLAGHRAVQIVA